MADGDGAAAVGAMRDALAMLRDGRTVDAPQLAPAVAAALARVAAAPRSCGARSGTRGGGGASRGGGGGGAAARVARGGVGAAAEGGRQRRQGGGARACEAAHATDGRLPSGGGDEPPSARRRCSRCADCSSSGVPPRRWKKPRIAAPAGARERRVQGLERDGGGWVDAAGGALAVEGVALRAYAEEGEWEGWHVENAVLSMLFGVVCWEALFEGGEGRFGSSLADAPADLFDSRRFRARRAGRVDGVLERLRGGGAAEALAEGFARHRGKVAVGVDWERFELPWLQRVARALGGEVVAAAVNAYASDYATFSHGAPDLLLLSTDGRRARLVEVKGPNDRLSDSQVAWIDVLVRAGAEVEVCWVERA